MAKGGARSMLLGRFFGFISSSCSFTFNGSMGNIPLTAVLFGQGMAFAGVMAFIFSDLVVLPVSRINARYHGWKMAIYILALMLVAFVIAALSMHYALGFLGMLPDLSAVTPPGKREYFRVNYQLFMNVVMLTINFVLFGLWYKAKDNSHDHYHDSGGSSLTDRVQSVRVVSSAAWLLGGLNVPLFL